jgi:alpha-tubulin suppressor-like RCC1 family protein
VARRHTSTAVVAALGAAALWGCVALLGTDDVAYRGAGAAEGGGAEAAAGDGANAETGPAPLADPSTLAVGGHHACAIVHGGRVYCWGLNDNGQIGIDAGATCDGSGGLQPCAPVPVEVPLAALDASVVELAAGDAYTCARIATGEVYCWTSRTGIVRVEVPPDAVQIAAALDSTFAIRDGGQLVAWGADDYSQLGDDRAAIARDPIPVDAGAVAWVQAGCESTAACAGTREGRLVCWGDNRFGQIALPVTTFDAGPPGIASCADSGLGCVPAPRPVELGGPVVAISLNPFSGCAALLDGHVKCFGQDFSGSLGDHGKADMPVPPVNVELTLGALAVGIASSHTFGCARVKDGRVLCWGNSLFLGRGAQNDHNPPLDVLLDDGGALAGVEELQSSFTFACARRTGGEVVCWGLPEDGQLGDPTSVGTYARPVPLP